MDCDLLRFIASGYCLTFSLFNKVMNWIYLSLLLEKSFCQLFSFLFILYFVLFVLFNRLVVLFDRWEIFLFLHMQLPQQLRIVLFQFLYLGLELLVSKSSGLDVFVNYSFDLYNFFYYFFNFDGSLDINWLNFYLFFHFFGKLQLLRKGVHFLWKLCDSSSAFRVYFINFISFLLGSQ
jgi:hypothetical protein